MNLKEQLLQLFDSNAIGCVGINNPNGADSIKCPSCGAYEEINGYTSLMEHITCLEHKLDCQLNKLYLSLKAGSSSKDVDMVN